MQNSLQKDPTLHIRTIPENFTPTQEQIYALARRLAPEIKALLNDDKVREEFENWQKKKGATE